MKSWMKNWKGWGLAVLGIAMSVFFIAIMRPPGGQSSAPGQDMPWQITRSADGATISVFGLTLGQSTLRDAVHRFGRRYELGIFQDRAGALSLEAYFRDAVVGGLNVRLVLMGQLSEAQLNALRTHAGEGQRTAEGGRRYPVAEADTEQGLEARVTAITYMPVARFDAELVRQRFGEPAERLATRDGAHWLYPPLGLDVLLGDNGEALLQYVPPPDFEQRLRAPLHQTGEAKP